jgi:hypothetical protein
MPQLVYGCMVVHQVSFDLPAHEYGIDGRSLSVCRAKVEQTSALWHQCYLESTLMPPVALRSTEASRTAACRERHPNFDDEDNNASSRDDDAGVQRGWGRWAVAGSECSKCE